MKQTGVYPFPPQHRSALEALPLALAVYQFVDGNTIALLAPTACAA